MKEVCELTPAVPTTVQVQLEEKKDFTVYEFIDDMPPVAVYATNNSDNIIFQIDVPEGVTVRMESFAHVVNALML